MENADKYLKRPRLLHPVVGRVNTYLMFLVVYLAVMGLVLLLTGRMYYAERFSKAAWVFLVLGWTSLLLRTILLRRWRRRLDKVAVYMLRKIDEAQAGNNDNTEA